MGRALMIQGAGSNLGKPMLVAGLCGTGCARGLQVAPFTPQNMSDNAAVAADGGEIGRARALQAVACGLDPRSDMNPVLLRPETDTAAQVILQRRLGPVQRRQRLEMVLAPAEMVLRPGRMPGMDVGCGRGGLASAVT